MAQNTDYDQFQEDPTLSGESGGGKTSFFSMLKNKTKDHGKKLKSKIQEKTGKTDDSSDFGETVHVDEEEEESPFSNSGKKDLPQSEYEASPTAPAENFPGNFTDIAKDETPAEAKADDSGLSKEFEGLSTDQKKEETAAEANPDDSGLSKDFEGLSTDEKTGGEETDTSPVPESTGADEVDSSEPATESIEDNVTSAKDETREGSVAGNSHMDHMNSLTTSVAEQPEQTDDKAAEGGKTWSQWAAAKVGMAKDTNAPTSADGTPVHEKAYDAAVGAKDTAVDQAAGAKDSVAAQIPDQSSTPSDPAQQTYFQKAAGGITGLFGAKKPATEDSSPLSQGAETGQETPAEVSEQQS